MRKPSTHRTISHIVQSKRSNYVWLLVLQCAECVDVDIHFLDFYLIHKLRCVLRLFSSILADSVRVRLLPLVLLLLTDGRTDGRKNDSVFDETDVHVINTKTALHSMN